MKRATLIELDQSFTKEKDGGQTVEVQFNPETLKVTFANEIKQPEGGDQGANTSGRQFVGAGTTKLALQLWFDVTAMEQDAVDDVRRLTKKVVFFMTPQKSDEDPKKLAPPGVRFTWGSFIFDGMVEALEESLEYFSSDGKPLRASISMTLSQQKILETKFGDMAPIQVRPGHKPPGHAPMTQARDGDSLQSMAGNKKGGSGWQGIAAANDIEDPLRMAPGQLIDLNASVSFGASAGFGASASVAVSAGASVSGGLNASLGGASASLSIG